jgi:uncharacterized protein YcaQ
VTTHQLSRADARRLAVRAQLLDRHRPGDLIETVQHLTMVQNDQTAAVAPSADLVAWCRLGSSYSPIDLATALDDQRLLELHMLIRPAEDLALYRAEMAAWPGPGALREWQEDVRDWFEANGACRKDILDLLRTDGPLPSRDLPDTCVLPWRSSGWTNNQNVVKMLDFMVARGEVAVAAREGKERLFDLAERVYPDDPVVPYDEAMRIRNERRLHALGIARRKSTRMPGEQNDVGDAGEPAVVDGVKGEWRVDPAYLDGQPFEGRAAIVSPLDRLVYDRSRLTELFEYDYQLEMYKPAAKRRWGYWAMPILYGDRLVGKLDATSERDAGVLRVDAVHQDVAFTKTMAAAVWREIDALASWLGLEVDDQSAAS